ncbi:MAG TPA: GGDEF domain-containing protein [Clostridia bacterium]|nr:GGDEF domain-containing protein [Clostridia bacterium]
MLSLFLYAEVNMVGAGFLLLMLTSRNKRSFRNMPMDQQLFNSMMFLNLLIFLFDTGMWLSDKSPLPVFKMVNYLSTTLYYFFTPWICLLWLMYTDFKIYESKANLLRRTYYYATPAVVCTALTLFSPFTGWFFVITPDNRYMRGPLLMVLTLATFSYLTLACGIVISDTLKNGWDANSGLNLPLVIYPLGVMASAVLQLCFYGLSVIWISTMLASTSIYINIQNGEILTDHLTGLYNRRRLDQHLQRRIKARHKKHLLFAMILDLDDFKRINDSFGHLVGDNALIRTAELLRKSCNGSDDFIARLGGDEFIIVGERTNAEEITALIDNINDHIANYNQSGRSSYILKLSMGYAVLGYGNTEDSFLAAADNAMYRNKLKNKAASANYELQLYNNQEATVS